MLENKLFEALLDVVPFVDVKVPECFQTIILLFLKIILILIKSTETANLHLF